MTEQEKFEKLPTMYKAMYPMYSKLALPELPEDPQKNKWYAVALEGALCANDEPYHACIKYGTVNKLLIVFCGGGVSVNEYTAARPNSIFNEPGTIGYYAEDVWLLGDIACSQGMLAKEEGNPFFGWTMLFVPYATADFHCGDNDFKYKGLNGEDKILRHHGYKHYVDLIKIVQRYIPNPDEMLVTGFSGGAFGAAILATDIDKRFECKNKTFCIDSAVLIYDWKKVAQEVWKPPVHIINDIVSDNITLDGLRALRKQNASAKILYVNSHTDEALVTMQNFFDDGKMEATEKAVKTFRNKLKETCTEVMKLGGGVFINELPSGTNNELGLTAHCMIISDFVFTLTVDGVVFIDWLTGCMKGNIRSVGLGLLK